MAIRILSEDLVNKIAAGEVIERPASVIKETLENSIDANATKIEIILLNSGKDEIIIEDNGVGITKDDLLLALQKHATSKIYTVEDLFSIKTLGFRGEALASINAISKLTLESRNKDSEFGYRLRDGSIDKIGMNVGTRIIVQDIFYNTPARKSYMKGDYVELSHITDIVRKYALSYPDKSFKLTNNGKVILQTTTVNDERTNIALLIDENLEKHLISVEYEDDNISVHGFISEPGYLKNTPDGIVFFLNDRYIKNQVLFDSLLDAYKSMIFLDQKPAAVVHLYMNPQDFDVNVHPRKLDVRFKNEEIVYEALIIAFKDAIKGFNESKQKEIESKIKIQTTLDDMTTDVKNTQIESTNFYSIRQQPKQESTQTTISEIKDEYEIKLSLNYSVLDIIDNTYIVLKYNKGLYIIDQHALHERVLFEKLQKTFSTKTGSQQLLSPLVIELSTDGFTKVIEKHPLFTQLGFEFEIFGNNSISLRRIPSAFFDIVDKKELFTSIISDLNISKIDDDVLYKLATKACKSAIKAHDFLTRTQLDSLISYMFETDMLTCPHGRPFFIELTKEELEKRFKR
ncbi:DNA mismatch repair endonuclease MutL [Candidatus Woesearchaeota archaeon]|nr:DNA mismatch repair endonuclease MutL [Candidatus Woesearchaeota archaeon]